MLGLCVGESGAGHLDARGKRVLTRGEGATGDGKRGEVKWMTFISRREDVLSLHMLGVSSLSCTVVKEGASGSCSDKLVSVSSRVVLCGWRFCGYRAPQQEL